MVGTHSELAMANGSVNPNHNLRKFLWLSSSSLIYLACSKVKLESLSSNSHILWHLLCVFMPPHPAWWHSWMVGSSQQYPWAGTPLPWSIIYYLWFSYLFCPSWCWSWAVSCCISQFYAAGCKLWASDHVHQERTNVLHLCLKLSSAAWIRHILHLSVCNCLPNKAFYYYSCPFLRG